ncbi:unnamed protein product [Owenia fusiformis]|uniref:Metalloendopeptidase n=1 Tax=Owenia fusiformis TaxID=6347 RepID=A0A8J1XL71_OWEFU|nr:unnamed protein product [Owenia fusiformis]
MNGSAFKYLYLFIGLLLGAHAEKTADEKIHLWPAGKVQYTIRRFSRDHLSPAVIANLTAAMAEISNKTGNCITFEELKGTYGCYPGRRCIKFGESGSASCASTVGMKRDPRTSVSTCPTVGAIIHQLLHILGVNDQHTRPDRDDYIDVHWNNIFRTGNFRRSFKKRTWDDSLGIPYCYNSIMHYDNYAFARTKGVKT